MSDDDHNWLARIAMEVIPFAGRLKERMIQLNKTRVRVECPNPAHTETKYIWATCNLKGNKHIHLGCEDKGCYYRMME